MQESDLNEIKRYIDKLKTAFPEEMLTEIATANKKFFDKIRDEKPEKITSNKDMQRILALYPDMRANQIDDFLLEHNIGDSKALKDFLDLEEKNKNNKPLIKKETK